MAIELQNKERNYATKEPGQSKPGLVMPGRRLWLTADGKALVEDGDPRAASLWCNAAMEMPRDEYERLTGRPEPKIEPEQKKRGPGRPRKDGSK